MADENIEESKTPLKSEETVEDRDCRTQIVIKKKDSLENVLFWIRKRIMLPLIAVMIIIFALLVIIFIILKPAPSTPHICHQAQLSSHSTCTPALHWYDKETVYEILPESFQDTSSKAANGAAKKGDGVGDIKGIHARLNYLKDDAKSKIIYINSMYESNDEEHMAVTDHTKIASLFGSMEDFDQLRKKTEMMEMRLIMDFIPNHTGKLNRWFLSSQKKEGKYSNYYIWAPCNPDDNTYPNNWMSVKGGRAWNYDKTRKECYYHQLESDKPDLNLWNSDVRQELESILRFWLDKGVDGFHVQNAQYLYEDRNLTDEVLTPGKTGNAYGDFEHNLTLNHPENAKILQSWKAVLETYNIKPGREKALIVTADDDPSTAMNYTDANVTIVRIRPLSKYGNSLAERIEIRLRDFNYFSRMGWMLSNKDCSRLASIDSPQLTKAFLTLQATLPGVPFNYYGNEIGMTDNPALPVPWRHRTPMQWNSSGTGFSPNMKWLSNPDNYINLNVKTEKDSKDDNTFLKVYTRLQELRSQKNFFQQGKMRVFRDGDILMYTRRVEGFPGFLVAINFGGRNLTVPFYKTTEIPKKVQVVFHSHKKNNTVFSLSHTSYSLDPGHAVVLEYQSH